jgi:hypothetical protein
LETGFRWNEPGITRTFVIISTFASDAAAEAYEARRVERLDVLRAQRQRNEHARRSPRQGDDVAGGLFLAEWNIDVDPAMRRST